MVERISSRLSQGHTPYSKETPRRTGLLSRVVNRLWTSNDDVNDDPNRPHRQPVRTAGGEIVFLDCRDVTLMPNFGIRSGDILTYGSCSVRDGDSCTAIGSMNGNLWVVHDGDEDAVATPIDGTTPQEIIQLHGFQKTGHQSIAFDNDLLEEFTEQQLSFLRDAPDIVADFTGNLLAIGKSNCSSHSITLSPCITKSGGLAFSCSNTITVGGLTIQIASALSLVTND